MGCSWTVRGAALGDVAPSLARGVLMDGERGSVSSWGAHGWWWVTWHPSWTPGVLIDGANAAWRWCRVVDDGRGCGG